MTAETPEDSQTASPLISEALRLLDRYLEERVRPHPVVRPRLEKASTYVTGGFVSGIWDETADLELRFLLPDDDHALLAADLRRTGLWKPGRDARVRIRDGEPFRRFRGVEMQYLSDTQLAAALRFEPSQTLWTLEHAAIGPDPEGRLAAVVKQAESDLASRLGDLRCEHYYHFREARNELTPRLMPRRLATLLAIKRGETVQEALRLAFLADGKPYPPDALLEAMAERETRAGAGIVDAVRALVAATEAETLEHVSKVLRDRVIFALQQGGVSDRWLEQWWLWPLQSATERSGDSGS
jgi:hypothetical protein